MTSSLLLGACSICGEPIVRHRRPDGRQITCAAVRRLDEALQANAQPRGESPRRFVVLDGGRDGLGDGEIG